MTLPPRLEMSSPPSAPDWRLAFERARRFAKIAIILSVIGVLLHGMALFIRYGVDDPTPQIAQRAERACTLAAGNARTNLLSLAPGHPQRDVALALLVRDAAWAPLCAKDGAAGARLQNDILDAVAPNPGDVRPLAQKLIELLERR